jgi:hypothetical protein
MSSSSPDHVELPRSDLKDAIGWTALGVAVLVASLRMDRLERQDINPYTVPGLLPGLLGIVMILLGLVLAVRSWRRGALSQPDVPVAPEQREQRKRIAVVLALCLTYGIVLVGHGLPYWIASTLFVTTAILVLQRISQDPEDRRLTPRRCINAFLIGLCAAVTIQLVFQELFLVRLP